MGAAKWLAEFVEYFHGADVVICGDNDQPGRDHVADVVAKLGEVPRRVRVLDLAKYWPEIEQSDDITDWFDAGHSVEELWAIVGKLEDGNAAPSSGNGGIIVTETVAADDGDNKGDQSSEEWHNVHGGQKHILPSPNEPMRVARLFVLQHCQHEQALTMRHWRGGW